MRFRKEGGNVGSTESRRKEVGHQEFAVRVVKGRNIGI